MKKWLPMLAALLLAVTALTACGRQEEAAQVVNPVEEVTAEQLADLGFSMEAPQGAEQLECTLISGSLAQMTWQYNDLQYSLRARQTGEPEDISGIYNGQAELHQEQLGEKQLQCCDGDAGSWISWYDEASGIQYCLSAKTDTETLKLAAAEIFA